MKLTVYSGQPLIIAAGAQNSPANFAKVLDFGVAGLMFELLERKGGSGERGVKNKVYLTM
jgi:hypothetical protein